MALPTEFTESHVRGYYGTVSHNVKSVYNRYLGWYDGNPANLDPLAPVEAGGRYVEFMGGADAVLTKARESFEAGDYRWVAQVVNHVVFADPGNTEARHLQADALEQLGYQAESATWRNAYLMGAKELREGSPQWGRVPTRDMSNAMNAEQLFDIIGVRFNPARFPRAGATVNVTITDLGEQHVLGVSRSAVHHMPDQHSTDAEATLSTSRSDLWAVIDDPQLLTAQGSNAVVIDGDPQVVVDLFGALDGFETQNLIEP